MRARPTENPLGAIETPVDRLITKPFLIVTAATALFFIYVGIMVPLIPRLVEERLGGGEFDIGLNLAAFSVAAIAVRPLISRWGDRHGRRVLMMGGALLAAVAAVVTATVGDLWVLLPLRAVSGMGEGALFVGATTMINDLAPSHRRAEAASYLSVAIFGGIGVGPIIGEAVIGESHFGRGMVVAAIAAFASACCCVAIADRPARRHREAVIAANAANGEVDHEWIAEDAIGVVAAAVPPPDEATSGRWGSLFHPVAVRPGLVLALCLAGFATFNAFMPEHAKASGLGGASWVFATYSIVCLVLRLTGAKLPERLGLTRTMTITSIALTTGLALFAAFPSALGIYGGTVLMGVGMSFLYPSLMAVTVNAAPEHERVKVISTFTMFFEVGSAVGGLLFGAIAEETGKRGGFLAGSISCVVAVVVFWKVLVPWVRARPISAGPVAVGAAH